MAATSRIWGVRIVVGYTIGSFETKGTNYVHTKSEELHKEKKGYGEIERDEKKHLAKYTETEEERKKKHEIGHEPKTNLLRFAWEDRQSESNGRGVTDGRDMNARVKWTGWVRGMASAGCHAAPTTE